MGQKTHPRGLRLGIIETWDSKWYSEQNYAKWLHEDFKIQKFVKEQLARAGISRVEVERVADRCSINIHTARPGIVIGRRGAEAEKLQALLEKEVGCPVRINVSEIREPELDAQLVSEDVATQIERRAGFKQAMRRKISGSIQAGALGVKIMVSGRLDGKEIARAESSIEGRVPLHTLRANVDYGFTEANTTYGKIGVKTWIFKGEIINLKADPADRRQAGRREDTGSQRPARRRGDRRSGSRQSGSRQSGSRQSGSRQSGSRQSGEQGRGRGQRRQRRSGGNS
ncbi:30S ribosomal protein S3 [Candidatus Poribacteria bacterium]|nr:30S ribosomal protein S3 [Candidatus Poribacteria bacterium]MYA54703.1 30S ribosomal protein S3 [Candidatus Poribacteria bacterium]